MTRRTAAAAALLAAVLVAGACAPEQRPEPAAPPRGTTSDAPDPTPTQTPEQARTLAPDPAAGPPGPPSRDGTLRQPAYGLGSEPPRWLGKHALPEGPDGYGVVRPTPPALRRRAFTLPDPVPMLPGHGYASRIVSPAPPRVLERSTWTPACPVGRDELAWLRVAFWGFDARRHTGELLVHASVAEDLAGVFRRLWQVRFPMERVVVVRSLDLAAPPTGDGNGTGGFVCRPITGGTSYSQHAYGRAVDVNTFQNPYHRDGLVLPELASAYLARDRVRPGMVTADGPVVAAFRDIGWGWGGDWATLKDYQHFSSTGR